jgi:TRAP-type C4-dicarboxylate transport system permease small subunit
VVRSLYKLVIRIVEIITTVGISLMALFTAYEIFMRELLGSPTIWTNEITTYLLIWVGLLGVVYAYHTESHVGVDLIFRRLSPRLQGFFNIGTSALITIFALCIAVYGYKYWWMAYSRGWRHFGMLDVPMSYTRIAMPIVGILLVFQLIIRVHDHINSFRSINKKALKDD